MVRALPVDLSYLEGVCQLCRVAGVDHFSLVSSQGASASSPLLYPKVKGQCEKVHAEYVLAVGAWLIHPHGLVLVESNVSRTPGAFVFLCTPSLRLRGFLLISLTTAICGCRLYQVAQTLP